MQTESFGLYVVSPVWRLTAAEAQPGGGRFGGGRFGGGRFGGGPRGGLNELMARPEIREELDITDDQQQELRAAVMNMFRGMRDRANFREMSDDERREFMEDMAKEARKEVMAVLTSEQASRLSELEFQFMVRQGDALGALRAAGVEIDDAQKDELRKSQESARKELQEKIAKLRQESGRQLLQEFVSDTQMERLMGKPFAFEDRPAGPPGMFGGRRGGPGGPGEPWPRSRSWTAPTASSRRR